MEVLIGIGSAISTVALLSVLAFLGKNWFLERLKLSLQKEHSRFLEELQWERKTKEQAAKVAEYLALARRLEENSPGSEYRQANQLSWELAMWLPEEVYKEMTRALVKPDNQTNELSVVVSVRKLLLRDKAGNLSQADIAHHAPGIGKNAANKSLSMNAQKMRSG